MGSEKKTVSGISKYNTIGFREGWLRSFLNKKKKWFKNNNLSSWQYKIFVGWLRDSEILNKNEITYLGCKLMEIFNNDELLVWEIIWTNLFYNSGLIKWYLTSIPWVTSIKRSDLKNNLKESFPFFKEGTLNNAFESLINTFRSNNFVNRLNLGVIEKRGKEVYVKKIGTDNVHPLAVLYSLYRYAISQNRYRLTVSELYRQENKDGGPYLIFGISRPALENILRWLQENRKGLIRVDLVADLDNIYLSEEVKDYKKLLDYY